MPPLPARVDHVSIDRDWRKVYDFAAKPENMPLWASGLASGLERCSDGWIARGPLGSVRVNFTVGNEFGIIDHVVTMESGLVVNNALRVVPNGSGAEVIFLLLKLPGMSEADFAADEAHVRRDLDALKTLLETQEPNG